MATSSTVSICTRQRRKEDKMGRIVGWVRPEADLCKENAAEKNPAETQETSAKAPKEEKKTARKEQE